MPVQTTWATLREMQQHYLALSAAEEEKKSAIDSVAALVAAARDKMREPPS